MGVSSFTGSGSEGGSEVVGGSVVVVGSSGGFSGTCGVDWIPDIVGGGEPTSSILLAAEISELF